MLVECLGVEITMTRRFARKGISTRIQQKRNSAVADNDTIHSSYGRLCSGCPQQKKDKVLGWRAGGRSANVDERNLYFQPTMILDPLVPDR